jgi:hypothetical protein
LKKATATSETFTVEIDNDEDGETVVAELSMAAHLHKLKVNDHILMLQKKKQMDPIVAKYLAPNNDLHCYDLLQILSVFTDVF